MTNNRALPQARIADARTDALEFWLAQEGQPIDDPVGLDSVGQRSQNWAGGWWILPTALLGLPLWLMLALWIF